VPYSREGGEEETGLPDPGKNVKKGRRLRPCEWRGGKENVFRKKARGCASGEKRSQRKRKNHPFPRKEGDAGASKKSRRGKK